jgi:hypothetical protein
VTRRRTPRKWFPGGLLEQEKENSMSNTVASLIAKLQQLPQDLEVMVGTAEIYECSDPEVITIHESSLGSYKADWSETGTKREVVKVTANVR